LYKPVLQRGKVCICTGLLIPFLVFAGYLFFAETLHAGEEPSQREEIQVDQVEQEAESDLQEDAELFPVRNPFVLEPGYGIARGPGLIDPSEMTLEAIVYNPGRAKAMIRGEIVGVGDQVFEYHVADIGKDFVILERGRRKHLLSLDLPYEKIGLSSKQTLFQ
jgi:hypothetical protein